MENKKSKIKYLILPFIAIASSFKRSLAGKEKLWKVFWLWGILGFVLISLLSALVIDYTLPMKTPYLLYLRLLSIKLFLLFIFYFFIPFLLLALNKNVNNFLSKSLILRRIVILILCLISPWIFIAFHTMLILLTIVMSNFNYLYPPTISYKYSILSFGIIVLVATFSLSLISFSKNWKLASKYNR